MAEKFHDDWEVVPFNLNMEPAEDPDARALVPANTERQLEAMPLRQRRSAQSYHAQPVLTAPPQPLLLKGPSAKKETTIKVPAGTRILPPRPNERVVGVKTNRSGEISSILSVKGSILRSRRGLTLKGLEQPKSVSSLQRQPRSTLSMLSRHLLSVARL